MASRRENKEKSVMSIVIVIALIFAFQLFASDFGGFVAGMFDYSPIDKDNTFAWISIHHIIQMIIALLLIRYFHKKHGVNFHLQPKLNRLGVKYVIIFSVVIFCYVIISYVVGYMLNIIAPYEFQLNSRNVLGTLGFQLLLSGPSEEILFRALPITIIGKYVADRKNKNAILIFIAAILFSLAHINWSMNPFILSFSWYQLAYAFVLGIAYGIAYIKTKSIFPAMIMHSLSNVFMVAAGYIIAVV